MTTEKFANLIVTLWRARQRFDAAVAATQKSDSDRTFKRFAKASVALQDAALRFSEVVMDGFLPPAKPRKRR
jgi:hypothetical protein